MSTTCKSPRIPSSAMTSVMSGARDWEASGLEVSGLEVSGLEVSAWKSPIGSFRSAEQGLPYNDADDVRRVRLEHLPCRRLHRQWPTHLAASAVHPTPRMLLGSARQPAMHWQAATSVSTFRSSLTWSGRGRAAVEPFGGGWARSGGKTVGRNEIQIVLTPDRRTRSKRDHAMRTAPCDCTSGATIEAVVLGSWAWAHTHARANLRCVSARSRTGASSRGFPMAYSTQRIPEARHGVKPDLRPDMA